MGTIKRTERDVSPDGEIQLVKVTFTPQVPNPAKQFDVEAVFHIERVEAGLLDPDQLAALLLSCTRTDTREPYTMSEPQRKVVFAAAVSEAAETSVGE